MMTNTAQQTSTSQTRSDEEAQRILAEVDGMMNLAGAQVTDPYVRGLYLDLAAGRMDVDDTIRAIRAHLNLG